MRVAGLFVALSALLHLLAVGLAGFDPAVLILLGAAVLYGLLALGLAQRRFWVAWTALVILLAGAAVAVAEVFGTLPVPTWVFAAIAVTDLAAVVALFGAIWAGRPRAAAG